MPDPANMTPDELFAHVEEQKRLARMHDALRKPPESPLESSLPGDCGVPGTGAPMFGGLHRW
jgi:hypothetical protein